MILIYLLAWGFVLMFRFVLLLLWILAAVLIAVTAAIISIFDKEADFQRWIDKINGLRR